MTEQQNRHGTVIACFRSMVLVENEQGTVLRLPITKKGDSLVCGDRVIFTPGADATANFIRRTPRRNLLERQQFKQKPRPLAANLDQLVVVSADLPGIDTHLIDRYLVAAELISIKPRLLINKQDLLSPERKSAIVTHMQVYEKLGYSVDFSSTANQQGLNALYTRLKNRTNVLVGKSGVGKSSLVKALIPDLDIRIGHLSHSSGQGRHTTTHTALYHLASGGALIDSPGIRQFGLWEITPKQAAQGFKEFQPYQGQCKYINCTHLQEPGCQILKALQHGDITAQRFESYRKLIHSLSSMQRRR